MYFGYLRETKIKAVEEERKYGKKMTGLEEYLKVIFPETDDWKHDKAIGMIGDGIRCSKRPDYRSESLKLIVEFDDLQHYNNPIRVRADYINNKIYEDLGYKVVRIPYFIQLTNSVVKELFGIEVEQKLFEDNIPSLGSEFKNTPAFLCPQGIKRMADEYRRFPQQYSINIESLKNDKNQDLVDWEYLEYFYNKVE